MREQARVSVLKSCTWFFLALFMSACAEHPPFAEPPPGSKLDVDWSKPIASSIIIDDSGLLPMTLEYVQGEAGLLIIRNDSRNMHRFGAEDFFRNIADWKMVTLDKGVQLPVDLGQFQLSDWPNQLREMSLLDTPPVKYIATDARETKVLYFVPLRAGVYPVDCEMLAGVTIICSAGNTITVHPSQSSL